jgi:hypothetical protein
MADGSKKPIEDVKVGDKVLATDPETGAREAKTVDQVFVHDDTVVDLVVDGQVITTTEDHPFWSVTDQRFERADELAAGEQVLTADGRVLTVSGLKPDTARQGAAYNLSIQGIHTYHVGDNEILVHNMCPTGGAAEDGSVPARDVHGADRSGRGVDVQHVQENGHLYYQDDGQLVRVLDNGNGTSDVVVRDPSNPSGAPTTTIKDMPNTQVQARINSGRWG